MLNLSVLSCTTLLKGMAFGFLDFCFGEEGGGKIIGGEGGT
jgi:hypothetical protein